MASLQEISEGLAKVLQEAGIRGIDYVAEDLNPPAGFVHWAGSTPETMGHGTVVHSFELYVFTQKASDRAGQKQLKQFASFTGTQSVWAKHGHNNDLDLTNTTSTIVLSRSLGQEEVAAYGYYGAVFEVSVTSSGV